MKSIRLHWCLNDLPAANELLEEALAGQTDRITTAVRVLPDSMDSSTTNRRSSLSSHHHQQSYCCCVMYPEAAKSISLGPCFNAIFMAIFIFIVIIIIINNK